MPQPVNLSSFDSSNSQITLNNSIEHAKSNRLLLENISYKINFNNEMIMYNENILYQYKNYLKQFTLLTSCPEEFYYKPELVSYKLYGTTDLWYLVLWMAEIPSALEFNQPVIRIFNPDKIAKINKIINKHREKLSNNHEEPEFIPDLTLKTVRIRDIRII